MLDTQSRRELAARLARRLNADYSPEEAFGGISFASPFETVTHACSIEGGSALVSNAKQVEFLKEFQNTVGYSAYLRMALLAHKEFHDLMALSQGTRITIEHTDKNDTATIDEKLAKIETVQDRFLNFRLAHRFSLVSFNTNHNLVYCAWRDAMQTDRLLTDIDADVRDAAAYLISTRQRLAEKKASSERVQIAKKASWFQAALTFLAGLEGSRAVVELIKELKGWPSDEALAADQLARSLGKALPPEMEPGLLLSALDFVPVLAGLAAAGAAWWFARRSGDKIDG